jgi:hypothetical protein
VCQSHWVRHAGAASSATERMAWATNSATAGDSSRHVALASLTGDTSSVITTSLYYFISNLITSRKVSSCTTFKKNSIVKSSRLYQTIAAISGSDQECCSTLVHWGALDNCMSLFTSRNNTRHGLYWTIAGVCMQYFSVICSSYKQYVSAGAVEGNCLYIDCWQRWFFSTDYWQHWSFSTNYWQYITWATTFGQAAMSTSLGRLPDEALEAPLVTPPGAPNHRTPAGCAGAIIL